MTTSITMPQLGETVLEGTVVRWIKREGERIEMDEPLFEISTDKVDTEVPSPVSGVVGSILVEEGQTVPVGTELARLEEDAGVVVTEAVPPPAATLEAETPGQAPPSPSVPPSQPPGTVSPPAEGGPRSQILSPLVRNLAAEHGVDLSLVPGTGSGGRITKRDVEAFVEHAAATPALEASSRPALQSVPAGPREEVVPLSHIRKQIAAHMHESLQISARAWTMVEVSMERIARQREQAKEAFRAREGFGLTFMPFVSRAVCEALLEFPEVNARLSGENLILHRYVNLGIAVAYEDGLIVPVVKDADAMDLAGLARAVNDVAVRARAKRLQPDEVRGATFTITNPGPFGSVMSVPIINQPNSAILSLDAIQKRAVVIDDAIAIREMVNLSMSWDHRVVDGALASRFLSRVKERLETWDFAEDLGL